MLVGVRFGAGPGQGGPATDPDIPYYDISQEDRALLEKVVSDTNSSDFAKARDSRDWLKGAINTVKPALLATPLAISFFAADIVLSDPVWNFVGKLFLPSVTDVAGNAKAWYGENDPAVYGPNRGVTVLTRCSYSGSTITLEAEFVPVQIGCGPLSNVIFANGFHRRNVGMQYGAVHVASGPAPAPGTATTGTSRVEVDGTVRTSPPDSITMAISSACSSNPGSSDHEITCEEAVASLKVAAPGCTGGGSTRVVKTNASGNYFLCGSDIIDAQEPDTYDTWACEPISPGSDLGIGDMAELGPIGDGGFGDPDLSDLSMDDLCDLIDELADYPYPPDTSSIPPTDAPPIDPGTGLPEGELPAQPPDSGANPGTGEPILPGDTAPGDTGLPPGDPGLPDVPTVPAGPDTLADPIESGNLDPEDGGCVELADTPAGFVDPEQPAAVAKPFQPGQEMTLITCGVSVARKIKRVTPFGNTAPDSDKQNRPKKSTQMCIEGAVDNEKEAEEKTCYEGMVGEAISSVLGEMGVESEKVVFDAECDVEIARPMCFKKGTNMRVILNKLLSLCGFCMFPQLDGFVIIGDCSPVNVHWYYHEDVDLIAFDSEWDAYEAYAYVEVFRGDRYDRAGRIVEEGYSIFFPVAGPMAVDPGKVKQIEVPHGLSYLDAAAMAATEAAKIRLGMAPIIGFAVPINCDMRTRHQIHIARPSLGFSAVYMITKLEHDYDLQNGHLTRGIGRWLRSGS